MRLHLTRLHTYLKTYIFEFVKKLKKPHSIWNHGMWLHLAQLHTYLKTYIFEFVKKLKKLNYPACHLKSWYATSSYTTSHWMFLSSNTKPKTILICGVWILHNLINIIDNLLSEYDTTVKLPEHNVCRRFAVVQGIIQGRQLLRIFQF